MSHLNKNQVVSGTLWKLFETIFASAVSFVFGIILARLVEPEAYGIVAITNIFVTFFGLFISSGLSPALIHKKNVDAKDYSSVLWVNIIFSMAVYLLLFVTAPLIAEFYQQPELVSVIRVISLVLFPSSLGSVLVSYISRDLDFKITFQWNTISGIIAGIAGIALAYLGFGVWALVANSIIQQICYTCFMAIKLRWKYWIGFSIKRVKSLTSFSLGVLGSTLTGFISDSLSDLVIGKSISATSLGYFNKGKSLAAFAYGTVNSTVSSVLFPTLASYQDDLILLKDVMRKSIVLTTFVIAPAMCLLALCAEPLICFFITDKWLDCVPVFQLYCLYGCLIPVLQTCAQAFLAIGKSSTRFILELIKLAVIFVLIVLLIPYGITALAAAYLIMGLIMFLITACYSKRYWNYSLFEQIKDIGPTLLLSALTCAIVWPLSLFISSDLLLFLLQGVSGVIVYILLASLFKMKGYYLAKTVFFDFWKKLKPSKKEENHD